MAGWSDAVEYYMSIAFALIHPSHREGFPNVLLQAGAMNCPIICSRIEGNIDIVENDKTGLIFEVKNEEELFAKMQYALSHPDIIKQYAAALRKHIEQYFDQPILHSFLHKRYLELLSA
jgi:glycosyltransferase involved in cell wall biosynthesis